MSQGDTPITLIGNLTAEPELRFTPSGAAVCNFTVASTPRFFDSDSKEWKDGAPLFMRCVAWRDMAENIAESLTRGSRVLVVGRLKPNNYETKEGEKRYGYQVEVEEVGPSLRWSTAKVAKTSRSGSGGGQGGGQAGGNYGGGRSAAPADDPWAVGPSGGGGGYHEDPPF